ncbi:MAG: hypothetical protein HQM08_27405 [Candidatus Riflebacteria bacterium]|nr:hypothetical protein [Candidatus Riflebacteria bacterium]
MNGSSELIFALKEDIGIPELFSGRKADLKYLMDWSERTKFQGTLSLAIFARRKKGKTALVQRFYIILFTRNDPMIIPFYYKVKEVEKSQLQLAEEFYSSLLSQYAAFKTRDISLITQKPSYDELIELLNNDPFFIGDIKTMKRYLEECDSDQAWDFASYAGERISVQKNERIIQILD